MQELDDDCLEEILSRLHVKDLSRFKSVSKKWNSIISAPSFIKSHLKKSISSPSHHRIFIPHPQNAAADIQDDIKEDLPRPIDARGYFLGASDGLVCYMDNFSDPTRIFMWNPATGVSKTVGLKLKFLHVMSWFGRESPDDEYKVVLGVRPHGEQLPSNHLQLVSLSLGGSRYYSTEEINIFPLVLKSYEEGKLFRGIVHWLANVNGVAFILTYNLGRKSLRVLAMPIRVQDNLSGLCVIDGCLSAVCGYLRDYNTLVYEVWVMKEYGKNESWTKLINIPYPGGVVQFMDLVGVSDFGDIFFRSSAEQSKLLIYNVAEKKYTNLVSGGYFVKMYAESLVSPNVLSKERTTAATKAVGLGKKRGRDSSEE